MRLRSVNAFTRKRFSRKEIHTLTNYCFSTMNQWELNATESVAMQANATAKHKGIRYITLKEVKDSELGLMGWARGREAAVRQESEELPRTRVFP